MGKMQLRDIGVPQMRTWLKKVLQWMEREDREPTTVHAIHRQLSSVMQLAVADEIIMVNVCANKRVRDLLPELSDEHPPCYDDKQAWALMTDDSIPWDRRMMNTIQALTGCRIGEAAGLRWSKYDRETPELGCLLLDVQYQDQPLKSARGKSRKARKVPVHPQLARALQDWWEVGYERIFSRPPTNSGFVVPDRRDWTRARTPKQVISQHTKDIKRLGFYEQKMGTHSFRRYFETYATLGGAREDMLERITHNRRGTMVNAYIDKGKLWSPLCEAMRCLDVDLSRGQVISLEARRGS
jgi:integrase